MRSSRPRREIFSTCQSVWRASSAPVVLQSGARCGRAAATGTRVGSVSFGICIWSRSVWKVTPSITVVPRSTASERSTQFAARYTRPKFHGVRWRWLFACGSCW